ncbi:MAG: glycosyltransferase family 2 protein [bacterium]|nr:glycosyltransferase family 2 protein [bacterium]
MSNPVRISGVIITLNEARHIRACIQSMLPVVDEVVVVDSFSTDETPAICQELGVRFLQHPFEGHIEQKNYAMQQAKHDCVLSLDADERVSEAMAEAILTVKQNWAADGYAFNRLNNYCGHWLRYAWYPDRKTRLWDRRRGQWGGTNPHDRVILPKGQVEHLGVDLLHYPYRNVLEHAEQLLKFADIDAKFKNAGGHRVSLFRDLILGPCFKFFKLYILKRGFLDGLYGFLYCCMAAGFNFLKYARLWELNRRPAK